MKYVKYDDASWHYGGDFPSDLPNEAGATHIGMFLAWMLLHGFASEELSEDAAAALDDLRGRTITGAQFLINELDEKLSDQSFSEDGNAFAVAYYQGLDDDSRYFDDYFQTFSVDASDLYGVSDTWANYERLVSVIDARYQKWDAEGRPEYIV